MIDFGLDAGLTRRSFLGAATAALASPAAAGSAAAHPVRLRLKLFPPTGRYSIGMVQLYLVDHSRRDPWVPSRWRELMVSVWYPALDDSRFAFAPWIQHKAGALYLRQFISSLTSTPGGKPVPMPGVSLPITHARLGAPAHLSARPYPVVLYQPGLGDIRETGTGLVSDLASRGYVVVTMDDTYEAEVVQFPGGRLVTPLPNHAHVGLAASARLADTRFVLHELARLRSGTNPDALHRTLPAGLSEALDVSKVGMFGHSSGGATAAEAMAANHSIRAGIDLDGSIDVGKPVSRKHANPQKIKRLAEDLARRLGKRPFMLMASQGHHALTDPSLEGFWSGLRGQRLFLGIADSQHFTYTDFEEFLPQLRAAGVAPRYITTELVTSFIGTVQPGHAVAAERAYIAAFFGLAFRGQHSKLLKGPSPQYPEIQFLAPPRLSST
jgi:dienelactone hydrolase